MKYIVNKILHAVGLSFVESMKPIAPDMDDAFRTIYAQTRLYTMTSNERMYALYKSIEYLSSSHIEGDIVECGVWRGGSAMICAYSLLCFQDSDRNMYLYDTYKGMTRPTKEDRTAKGNSSAFDIWQKSEKKDKNEWCYADLTDVKQNLARTKYSMDRIKFIEGAVEDTIPKFAPKNIALLRLDTDWYESTKHELEHLFPRVVKGGVVIIDDYGHWRGAKKAVDEYVKKHNLSILLNRIDYSGRLAIKS